MVGFCWVRLSFAVLCLAALGWAWLSLVGIVSAGFDPAGMGSGRLSGLAWSGSKSRLDWDQMGFGGLGWRGLNLVGAGLAGKKWDRVSSNFPELGPDWMGSAVLG